MCLGLAPHKNPRIDFMMHTIDIANQTQVTLCVICNIYKFNVHNKIGLRVKIIKQKVLTG